VETSTKPTTVRTSKADTRPFVLLEFGSRTRGIDGAIITTPSWCWRQRRVHAIVRLHTASRSNLCPLPENDLVSDQRCPSLPERLDASAGLGSRGPRGGAGVTRRERASLPSYK